MSMTDKQVKGEIATSLPKASSQSGSEFCRPAPSESLNQSGNESCSKSPSESWSNSRSQANKQPRSKKWLRRGVGLSIALVLLVLLAPALLTNYIYRESFGQRFTTPAYYAFQVAEFPGLKSVQHDFPSQQGQLLRGYYYTSSEGSPQALVILVHGFGGGGHNSYLDVVDYLARQGYGVFAYDATANDESEGSQVGGLPQGLIDLDYAISYVQDSGAFPSLPILLWGHSWGAYSATAVLKFHPDIQAVASFSGFNSSMDLMQKEGEQEVGDWMAALLPYFKLYEKIKFGKYAGVTSLEGFAASSCPILLVQGAEDTTVPAALGYDLWQAAYGDSDRFRFILRPYFSHNNVYYSAQAANYLTDFQKDYRSWQEHLSYDRQLAENQERFRQDQSLYIAENLDREVWTHLLDEKLMQEVSDFYEQALRRPAVPR